MAEPTVKPRSREVELKAAIVDADLPTRDLKVFMVLMKRATWVTASIPDKFQPRSLEELAGWCRMSRANLARSLNHLQRHGWLERHRHITESGIGGRGHPTRYQLARGRDCDCPIKPSQDEPLSGEKASQPETVSVEKPSQDRPINRLRSVDVSAGQTPVSAKEGSDEGGREERATVCVVCSTPLDPILPALGYRTHPCCDPDETPALETAS